MNIVPPTEENIPEFFVGIKSWPWGGERQKGISGTEDDEWRGGPDPKTAARSREERTEGEWAGMRGDPSAAREWSEFSKELVLCWL